MRKLTGRTDTATLRLIDVNLNRAREGIRVVEDTLRFVKNDRRLYSELRGIRHLLDGAAVRIYPELLKTRSTPTDVGSESKEEPHRGIKDIVFANLNRIKESLRVLEEYSRIFPAFSGTGFKKIRFKIYLAEKKIGKKYFAEKN